jgi:hypothetical protein
MSPRSRASSPLMSCCICCAHVRHAHSCCRDGVVVAERTYATLFKSQTSTQCAHACTHACRQGEYLQEPAETPLNLRSSSICPIYRGTCGWFSKRSVCSHRKVCSWSACPIIRHHYQIRPSLFRSDFAVHLIVLYCTIPNLGAYAIYCVRYRCAVSKQRAESREQRAAHQEHRVESQSKESREHRTEITEQRSESNEQ